MRLNYKMPLLFLLFPVVSYAGWPTFQVVAPEQVMQKVITSGCAVGEGYIPTGTKFQIINRYIPPDQTWSWVYTGTNQCQKIPTQSQDLKYIFYEQDGRYAGSTISTVYGTETTGPLFTFTFVIPAEPEGWDCGPMVGHEPPMMVGCARDMKISQK